jgi:6-phosphofructokinase 1
VAGASQKGYEVLGIRKGWEGLLTRDAVPLTWEDVEGIASIGGTLISTSRTNPARSPEATSTALENAERLGLWALVAIGGDDTLGAASHLQDRGLRCIGIPKTIDNDVGATDATIGFDTAVNVAMAAIDRLHTTARSHERVVLVEVMGRDAGWVALYAGIGAGAHMILIPEVEVNTESIAHYLVNRKRQGYTYAIIVVAEGVKRDGHQGLPDDKAVDEFGHPLLGGVTRVIADELERISGIQTRYTILGYIQRGGTPTLFDRFLASRYGLAAVELASQGTFGHMVALRGRDIVSVPLADAVSKPRLVPRELYEGLSPLWLPDGTPLGPIPPGTPREWLPGPHPN